MKKLVIFFIICFHPIILIAQQTNNNSPVADHQNPLQITIFSEYTTQHYWRGLGRGNLFGKGPAFESRIIFKQNKWTYGLFAAASFDNIYKTAMPFVIYNVNYQFSVALQDIYSPGKTFWQSDPLNFNINESKHFVDFYTTYKFKKIPLNLKWASVVLGYDPKEDGGRNFSSYAEVSTVHKFGRWQASGAIGVTPWKGLYVKEAGICNLETKLQYNFTTSETVPSCIYVKATYNTITNFSHFIAGATFTLKLK
jgi:hypothetical protein